MMTTEMEKEYEAKHNMEEEKSEQVSMVSVNSQMTEETGMEIDPSKETIKEKEIVEVSHYKDYEIEEDEEYMEENEDEEENEEETPKNRDHSKIGEKVKNNIGQKKGSKKDEDSKHPSYQDQPQDFPPTDDTEEEDYPITVEDDTNTVESGTTTKVKGKKQGNNLILPPFIRYQIMITPLKKELDDKGEEILNVPQRIRTFLMSMCEQLTLIDEEAKIISWRNKKNFTYMNTEEFSEEVSEIAKYFNGYRKGLEVGRRIYIKFGLHTPNDAKRTEREIKQWAQLYGYTVTKCMIQADNASYIGWITYSTYYTNTDALRQRLQEEGGQFEWGFKMVTIDAKDSDMAWKHRLKALGVYVPANCHDLAIKVISEALQKDKQDHSVLPDMIDSYLFVPPEDTVDDYDSKIAYKSFVRRHARHIRNLGAKFTSAIQLDVDRDLTTRNGNTVSLREIILNIKVTDKNNLLYGEQLFQSMTLQKTVQSCGLEKEQDQEEMGMCLRSMKQ